MVNSEHRGAASEQFPQLARAAAMAHHAEQENTYEVEQKSIPVPVLVKHEEYASAEAKAYGHHGHHEESDNTSARAPRGVLAVMLNASVNSSNVTAAPSSSNSAATGTGTESDTSAKGGRKEKRSTKSKCPPGLRSGKWTPEEEAFTNMLIHYFKRGLLHVEDGTSLRWYLAKRLNCEAMRVTKKLKGNSSIGKQIFRALENTDESQLAITHAAEELAVVERHFFESLASAAHSNSGSALNSSGLIGSQSAAARAKRSSPHKSQTQPKPPHLEAKKLVVTKAKADSEDAKLLLHFFVEAVSESAPMEKKRLFSDVESSQNSSGNNSGSSSSSSDARTNEDEEDDPEGASSSSPPPSKRHSVKIENLM